MLIFNFLNLSESFSEIRFFLDRTKPRRGPGWFTEFLFEIGLKILLRKTGARKGQWDG